MIRKERYAYGRPNEDKIPCHTCQCRLKGEEGALKGSCQVYDIKPPAVDLDAKECPYYVEGDPVL